MNIRILWFSLIIVICSNSESERINEKPEKHILEVLEKEIKKNIKFDLEFAKKPLIVQMLTAIKTSYFRHISQSICDWLETYNKLRVSSGITIFRARHQFKRMDDNDGSPLTEFLVWSLKDMINEFIVAEINLLYIYDQLSFVVHHFLKIISTNIPPGKKRKKWKKRMQMKLNFFDNKLLELLKFSTKTNIEIYLALRIIMRDKTSSIKTLATKSLKVISTLRTIKSKHISDILIKIDELDDWAINKIEQMIKIETEKSF